MVEVMKIMVTSFKRSHAHIATLSASNQATGHWQLMPLSETPGHSQASWVILLWGHFPFLLGPGAHKVLFVPSQSLLPQSCVSSGRSMVMIMASSSNLKRGLMPYPGPNPEPELLPPKHCQKMEEWVVRQW